MLLTKDSLKQHVKRKEKIIEFPEFSVRIVAMSIAQQIDIEDINKNKKKDGDIFYPVLQFCCVDVDGNPLFDNVEEVKNLPGDFAAVLFAQCMEISAMGSGDMDKKAKN